jgi:DNA polymerase III epsilon subunit-like protein
MAGAVRFWQEAEKLGFEAVFAMDFEGGDRTGVVEFGVVEITASGLGRSWTGLCAPEGAIPGRESETHGLYLHDLKGRLPFAEQWEFFRDLRRSGPFLAHSAQVEDRFLRRQWRTPGSVRDWSGKGETRIDWGPWLDTCGLFRTLRPDCSAGLGDLVVTEDLGERLAGEAAKRCPGGRNRWHAALYDTLASALLFERTLEVCSGWGVPQFFWSSRGHPESLGEQLDFL